MSDIPGMPLPNDAPPRRSWLRNAFAVEDPAEFRPTPEQEEMINDVCRWIAQRRLTTAALASVEMHRPANFLIANILHFLRPSVSACLPLLHLLPLARRALPDMKRYRAFAEMIEHRGAADYIVRALEASEAQTAASKHTVTPGGQKQSPDSTGNQAPSSDHNEQQHP